MPAAPSILDDSRPPSRERPDWPLLMTAETLAEYLDMRSKQTLYRHIKKCHGFPRQDPHTHRWSRPEIDRYFAASSTALDSAADSAQSDQESWRQELSKWGGLT